MVTKTSAGLLLYRRTGQAIEVLIAHMGGPFWARKDAGGWSIPKGEYDDASEDAFAVALREFEEELGSPVPAGEFLELGSSRQPSGKVVTVWAAEGVFDAAAAKSNTFEMEWPKGSGRMQSFPEVDRAAWFDLATAREKLLKGQTIFLDRLAEKLEASAGTGTDLRGA